MITSEGWNWFWTEISSSRYFKNPIISKFLKKALKDSIEHPSKIEEAYGLINQGLDQTIHELAMIH